MHIRGRKDIARLRSAARRDSWAIVRRSQVFRIIYKISNLSTSRSHPQRPCGASNRVTGEANQKQINHKTFIWLLNLGHTPLRIYRSRASAVYKGRAMSAPQFPKNSFDITLENKQEPSVENAGGRDRTFFVSSIKKDEPIVTRIELWSYYRQCFPKISYCVLSITISFKVYYNGDNVCRKCFLFSRPSRLKNCSNEGSWT